VDLKISESWNNNLGELGERIAHRLILRETDQAGVIQNKGAGPDFLIQTSNPGFVEVKLWDRTGNHKLRKGGYLSQISNRFRNCSPSKTIRLVAGKAVIMKRVDIRRIAVIIGKAPTNFVILHRWAHKDGLKLIHLKLGKESLEEIQRLASLPRKEFLALVDGMSLRFADTIDATEFLESLRLVDGLRELRILLRLLPILLIILLDVIGQTLATLFRSLRATVYDKAKDVRILRHPRSHGSSASLATEKNRPGEML